MKRSKKEVTPNWHPNFRIAEDLPDIKPIRTGFLINVAAVSICLILAYLFIQQEVKRMTLGNAIQTTRATVQETQATNSANLRKSADFVREAKKMEDLSEFYDSPVTAYNFLLDLSEIRPEGLIFDSITFREIETIVRRQVQKTYELAINGKTKDLIRLNEFKAMLSAMDAVEEYGGQVNENIQPPNETTGIYPYTIEVQLTPQQN